MIFCRLHQWLWSCADAEGRRVPSWTSRHIELCPNCANATASMLRLDNNLRECADVPSEAWHEALMLEVQRVSNSAPIPVHLIHPLPVALAAAAIICVAFVCWQLKSPVAEADQEMSATPENYIIAMVADVTGGSLEQEVIVLEQDALRAVKLATSMLPL